MPAVLPTAICNPWTTFIIWFLDEIPTTIKKTLENPPSNSDSSPCLRRIFHFLESFGVL